MFFYKSTKIDEKSKLEPKCREMKGYNACIMAPTKLRHYSRCLSANEQNGRTVTALVHLIWRLNEPVDTLMQGRTARVSPGNCQLNNSELDRNRTCPRDSIYHRKLHGALLPALIRNIHIRGITARLVTRSVALSFRLPRID